MPAIIKRTLLLTFSALLLLPLTLQAAGKNSPVGHYPLPEEGDIVGEIQTVTAEHEDTLLEIGHRYGVGYEEMQRANPGVSMWAPGEGTEVTIPTRFILPPGPREGVVINVAEMRLYYYPPTAEGETPGVETYPISVGRMDWSTPLGTTHIKTKVIEPAWYPPQSIIEEHAARGDKLPQVVPPGPDNPLGEYAMLLDIPGYLIHGTNRPQGVGMRVTHGCIRMLPEDIERLFPRLPVGTPVRLINEPLKLGWSAENILYVQAYPTLQAKQDDKPADRVGDAVTAVSAAIEGHRYPVNYARLRHLVENPTGQPQPLRLFAQQHVVEPPPKPLYEQLELVTDPAWWYETKKALSMTGPS
ncbi:L,D-transpeptidase ErfK/SrfK [Modicisalibacter muralis]|uniref:L,D-transpeptidase ErfK/SrfK n=1 Tax=Modicisalibacter muralis TaxID=119000 RepID=A0A1G9LPY9_9GAMM|nr:L,D-transpeptidase family protein [Halomonas muralis]SDL63877.1 L,D-transpeptidase ErfK/SrfK [Halomonas muralis]